MRQLKLSRWIRRGGDALGSGIAVGRWSSRILRGGAVAWLLVVSVTPLSAARAADSEAHSVPGTREWIVGNGDSWFSMRSRICPVELLRDANPSLADRDLRPGERITAPFVPFAQFDQVKLQLDEARQAERAAQDVAAAEQKKTADLQASIATRDLELESLRGQVAALTSAAGNRWLLQWLLGGTAVLLAAGLAFALAALYATRRSSSLIEERLKHSEEQYTDLRRSIADLDVQLQRRMLKLLSWHESRVISERDVEAATAPVVEMARRLKERHAG